MSTRTTVTLDEDVIERVKRESRSRGASFRDTLNELLRAAFLNLEQKPSRRKLTIRPTHMGYRPGLPYDSVETLLEIGEGERHR
ncbi:MAG: ribbon-helix-helix domain-containing protein [Acidobacteriota bacterium]|nr:ribbon-helix-helix domain-containing protein [Acidobacteriota bacterium]